MPTFLCRNHPDPAGGAPFEADKPVCPFCGLDRDERPEYRQYIAEREVVHFDPPHPVLLGGGLNKTACGSQPLGGDPRNGRFVYASGDRLAVTCPACKLTDAFKSDKPSGARLHAKVDADAPAG